MFLFGNHAILTVINDNPNVFVVKKQRHVSFVISSLNAFWIIRNCCSVHQRTTVLEGQKKLSVTIFVTKRNLIYLRSIFLSVQKYITCSFRHKLEPNLIVVAQRAGPSVPTQSMEILVQHEHGPAQHEALCHAWATALARRVAHAQLVYQEAQNSPPNHENIMNIFIIVTKMKKIKWLGVKDVCYSSRGCWFESHQLHIFTKFCTIIHLFSLIGQTGWRATIDPRA